MIDQFKILIISFEAQSIYAAIFTDATVMYTRCRMGLSNVKKRKLVLVFIHI